MSEIVRNLYHRNVLGSSHLSKSTMADIPFTSLFLIGGIFFLGGLTQGLTGFGLALVALPLLSFFLDIKVAVPLCTLNGLVITLFLSLQLRKYIDFHKIMPLLVGCLPGVFFGVLFLKKADENLLKILLGILLIAYASYRLCTKQNPGNIHRSWSYIAGFFTGAISGAFSAGGPPTIIYTTLTGWPKDDIKATLSGFFFAGGAVTALAHAAYGLTTPIVLKHFGAAVLFVLAGVVTGAHLYNKFDTTGYLKLILIGLIVLGVMMIGSVNVA